MGFQIRAMRHPGLRANARDFPALLGLDFDQKWPTFALDPVEVELVDGRTTKMWLFSRTWAKLSGKFHRCYAKCPDCGAHVPAGRTAQHKCKGISTTTNTEETGSAK